jgi:hypothetical protein
MAQIAGNARVFAVSRRHSKSSLPLQGRLPGLGRANSSTYFSLAGGHRFGEDDMRELGTFTVRITEAGNESFEAWREKDRDDLVLAVALACWAAESLRWSRPRCGRARPTAWAARSDRIGDHALSSAGFGPE